VVTVGVDSAVTAVYSTVTHSDTDNGYEGNEDSPHRVRLRILRYARYSLCDDAQGLPVRVITGHKSSVRPHRIESVKHACRPNGTISNNIKPYLIVS
jgi:hypothetical protein